MLHRQQRFEVVGGIFSYRVCRRHHDAGVLQHLLACVVDENAVQHDGGNRKPDGERHQNRQIELGSQADRFGSVAARQEAGRGPACRVSPSTIAGVLHRWSGAVARHGAEQSAAEFPLASPAGNTVSLRRARWHNFSRTVDLGRAREPGDDFAARTVAYFHLLFVERYGGRARNRGFLESQGPEVLDFLARRSARSKLSRDHCPRHRGGTRHCLPVFGSFE